MTRSRGRITCGVFAAAALVLAVAAVADFQPDEPEADATTNRLEPAETAPVAPINILLTGPGSLDALIKSLTTPDFVLLKGDEYRKLLERLEGQASPRAPGAVIDSVSIEGTVGPERADLAMVCGMTLRSPEPVWVPIRLDDQVVTGAREGPRDLPLRVAGGSWQVQVREAGTHRVRIDLKVPLRSTAEGRRIDLAIPEAAATDFRWEVADRVAEAATGSGELVDIEPMSAAGPDARAPRTRLSAHLTPRARLDVSWRGEAEPGVQLPPLLTMQGEIAIDIDPGSFRTRSTWAVHAVRGTTRSLELRLDPADEVLELELDGQPVPAGIERGESATLLTIVLNDPLRPGLPKSLVMTTRRSIATAASTAIAFSGFTLTNAREQWGAIGIAQHGNLWVGGTTGRGLRRIDPRTALPPDLRARPATALAYFFADQPFELALSIDPSPPLVRTEAKTSVWLEASQARIDTWLNYQPAHGRLFDLAIGLPEGLEIESVGPKEVVEASQRDPARSGAARVLRVRLTPQAQEDDDFTVHLTGRQSFDPAQAVDLALFQPLDATSTGGRIAVLTGRNLTADVRDDGGRRLDAFRPAVSDPPADWPWPAERPGATPPALWLRHDGSPAILPLEVDVHPRSVSARTNLLVEVDRRSAVLAQETELTVHFGTLDHIDMMVPAALRGRWEPEGSDVVRRSELGRTASGDHLVRLVLGKEVRDKIRLRFRIRTPLPAPQAKKDPAPLPIDWIYPVEAERQPLRVHVAAEPGIELEPTGKGWVRGSDETALDAPAPVGGQPLRFVLVSEGTEPGPLSLRVAPRAMAELPPLVASRLWLRTVQGPENDLRCTALYLIETHDESLAVALPPGAEWVRAKVAGTTVSHVEQLQGAAGYRLMFPRRAAAATAASPVLVELEYTVAAAHAGRPWTAPRLLEGGLVQQTQWEIHLPWGRAVVGVPAGWTDENRWVWEGYSFHRHPWQSTASLTAWAAGSAESPAVDGLDDPAAGEGQSYLFGQLGPPSNLPILIASRGWLVGICSGTVLALGAMIILTRRPQLQLAWAGVLALALAVAALVQPSATVLALQSAMIGVVLTLLTAWIERMVHRRRPTPVFGETTARSGLPGGGSSVNRSETVGSDDSTAIRVRPVSSTLDHFPAGSLTPDREGAAGRGAGTE